MNNLSLLQHPKLCSYYHHAATFQGHRERMEATALNGISQPFWKNRRKRVKCPKCGRKIFLRVSFCHDGCCEYLHIPLHKRKHWWKPPKKNFRGMQRKKKLPLLSRKELSYWDLINGVT